MISSVLPNSQAGPYSKFLMAGLYRCSCTSRTCTPPGSLLCRCVLVVNRCYKYVNRCYKYVPHLCSVHSIDHLLVTIVCFAPSAAVSKPINFLMSNLSLRG